MLIFDHFSEILDKMLENPFYMWYLQQPDSSWDMPPISNSISVHCGVDRAAIVDSNYDWVVEFDLAENSMNSCENELLLYSDATNEGVESFFVECQFIGMYERDIEWYKVQQNGKYIFNTTRKITEDFLNDIAAKYKKEKIRICLPLYAYRRAEEVGKVEPDCVYDDFCEEYADIVSNKELLHHRGIIEAFLNDYDIDFIRKVDNFLETYGIGDFHCYNIGVICGKHVMIDWANCSY